MTDSAIIDQAVNSSLERAKGALLGLAAGDAIGMPALYHRSVRLGSRRECLWPKAAEADKEQVLRFPLPFTVSETGELALCGTDDTEMAALTAQILLSCSRQPSAAELFSGWQNHVVDVDDIWLGVAERSSVKNIKAGLKAPDCGGDNPAYADDGAVSRAVPIGIRFSGHPAQAADVARQFAEITHAEDGVWAAGAMAASISAAVGGATFEDALTAGIEEVPADSWLSRGFNRAFTILEESGSGFAAVPRWINEIANGSYSYGTIAAETLPIAYAVVSSAGPGIAPSIQLAVLIAKQSDSMPAFAGALAGAIAGSTGMPASWFNSLNQLRGVIVPSVKGILLSQLAGQLLDQNPS